MRKYVQIILLMIIGNIMLLSCNEADSDLLMSNAASSRSLVPDYFDWENADWMPTPSEQSRIPSPWVGQGSISSMFGLDVVNDRKKTEGWVLVYNSFTNNGTGSLINPYFVLYNKYRGLLRIFMYTTTSFIMPSTYLQDGISVISNQNTTLLNFLGSEIIDATKKSTIYKQMQPAPSDGSMPLASDKWYMMQYEMAYDPTIADIPYNQIQLNWNLNFYNVEEIDLGGTVQGTIKGTIGETAGNNLFSPLKNMALSTGKGVIAGVGQNVITKNTINTETGENKLGLNNDTFKAISTGLKSAVSAATGNWVGAAAGLLSAVIGGSKSTILPVSLNVEANVKLSGTGTNSGSFPSMPISFWMPGTNVTSDAVGYIPLYGKSLGVINFVGKPQIVIPVETEWREVPDEPFDPDRMVSESESTATIPNIDYSQYILINPEVQQIAKVEILQQDLIAKDTLTNKIYH